MARPYPTTFESSRLLFVAPTLKDAPSIFENYAQDPRITEHLLWEPHTDLQGTRAFLQTCIDAWAQGTTRREWTIRDKSAIEKGVIGMIGCFEKSDPHRAEIGYVLAAEYWGQGLMTEALTRLIEVLRGTGKFERVQATHHASNPASGRVMQKAGMDYKGREVSGDLYPCHGTQQPSYRYECVFSSDN